jgi:hypothetical protein
MSSEKFTRLQTIDAIRSFLEFGEKMLVETHGEYVKDLQGHAGYYSGSGWAARCLAAHLERLECTTQHVRPMDLHSHTPHCDEANCIAVLGL